jgi:hypothetical protein
MPHDRFVKSLASVLTIAVLVFASLGFSSCSRSPQLPESARDALMEYWESLPSYPSVENRIIRAWPGVATEDLTSEAPLMDVWCVEAEISSSDDPSVDGELLVWIVTRENQEAPWSAALLASLSSIWPYQACGDAPG